jgi:hypothetical protein
MTPTAITLAEFATWNCTAMKPPADKPDTEMADVLMLHTGSSCCRQGVRREEDGRRVRRGRDVNLEITRTLIEDIYSLFFFFFFFFFVNEDRARRGKGVRKYVPEERRTRWKPTSENPLPRGQS